MTIDIGRLCVKVAGRDAGKKCVIIDILDERYVLVDGETRRRKTNILHIEPMAQIVKIEKNASHVDVAKALEEFGISARNTKPRQKTQRPRKIRKNSQQLREQKKDKKKLRDIFKPKKKDELAIEKNEGTLEQMAGAQDISKEENKLIDGEFKVVPVEEAKEKKKQKESKTKERAQKPKSEKNAKHKEK